jgi:hypothetical protein
MASLKKNFLSIDGTRAWMAWWVGVDSRLRHRGARHAARRTGGDDRAARRARERFHHSTYLIHYPIFHMAMLYWPGTQDATRPQMLTFLWSMLPLVLIASAVSYRVIEQPFMQIGRRRPLPVPLQAL